MGSQTIPGPPRHTEVEGSSEEDEVKPPLLYLYPHTELNDRRSLEDTADHPGLFT